VKDKVGGGFWGDVAGLGESVLGEGGRKQNQQDKEDEKLAMEVKGIKDKEKRGRGRPRKGDGVVDKVKKVAKRVGKVVKSGIKILKKEGDLHDLANIITLGKYGEKYGGNVDNIQESNIGVKNIADPGPKVQVERIVSNGGAKKKKGGNAGNAHELVPRAAMPGSSLGFGKKTNAWQICVQKTKKDHPELKGLKCIIKYIKDHNLYKK